MIEPAQGALVVALVHDQLRLLALSEDGRVRHGNRVPIAGHRFDIAAHPGPRDALLLRHRGDRWALEHVRADVSLEPLATFGSERAPSGALAANDTEALVPTAGGKVMRLPLHGSRRSELSPVSDGPVRRMDVVLRPGDSVGAVLYEARRPDGRAHELRLRPLVCAR